MYLPMIKRGANISKRLIYGIKYIISTYVNKEFDADLDLSLGIFLGHS